ncbi:DUF2789 domain-containing protein [Luteimonas viscosa]|uniref:DUF2789 domain-containing protein n=1 Tax=Luteimonas viscosa TaxID=1132694 RepID=A0A5D4XS04_9GAMM|nr:DUF2789 domain-containing protein [Luteimonas viscosa]TYT26541.1 DUF2789 domain-containing protein [Luteimonas viscosa]
MDETTPNMTNLFLQLGLDADHEAIAAFIGRHQLPGGVHIADAPYWSEGQRQFLAEQLRADARWTTVVDQLNESLHEDAVKRQTGL